MGLCSTPGHHFFSVRPFPLPIVFGDKFPLILRTKESSCETFPWRNCKSTGPKKQEPSDAMTSQHAVDGWKKIPYSHPGLFCQDFFQVSQAHQHALAVQQQRQKRQLLPFSRERGREKRNKVTTKSRIRTHTHQQTISDDDDDDKQNSRRHKATQRRRRLREYLEQQLRQNITTSSSNNNNKV